MTLENREISEKKAEGNSLEGYAILWNVRSKPIFEFGRRFTEKINRGSIRNINSKVVRLYYNHDKSMPLASTENGSLVLEEDDKGLRFRAEIANTTLGNDVKELLRTGILTGEMSFGFITMRDKWNAKKDERSVEEMELIEISIVQDGAYPTESQLRSQVLKEITQKRINAKRQR